MPQSATDKVLAERIANDFAPHALDQEQRERYARICAEVKTLALTLAVHCPDSRERSLALTKLEECGHWARASIERED